MDKYEFKGPFKFEGENSIFDEISDVVNGVYLWCVKNNEGSYLVYYVGEAVDIKNRMYDHLKNQLEGKYTGHCPDSLKNNVCVLMHRAGVGMVPRFSHMDRKAYNQNLIDNLYLFYLPLPENGQKEDDKWLRCRFETGIVTHIENQGQNIVRVGHLRYWKEENEQVLLSSGDNKIESISNEIVTI